MRSSPTLPTGVPLIRMPCRALSLSSLMRPAVLCVSHPETLALIVALTSCRSYSIRAGSAAFSRSLRSCRMHGSSQTLSPRRSRRVALSRTNAGYGGGVPLRIRTRARLHSSRVGAKKVGAAGAVSSFCLEASIRVIVSSSVSQS